MNHIHSLFIKKTGRTSVQFIRYTLVGCMAFFVDSGALFMLTHFAGLHYLQSTTFAFIFGLTANYIMSKLWVFTDSSAVGRHTEFIVFALIGVTGLLITDLLMYLLTDMAGIFYLISKLLTAGIVNIWNFAARKALLFRNRPDSGR